MGIENRGYMQDEPAFRFGSGRRPMEVVKLLIAANVIVFVLQIVANGRLESWFMLDLSSVLRGQIWRLTTYDFLHSTDGPWHLLFNMWLLYMAGLRVESRYGSREFLAVYMLAGIVSGIGFLLWNVVTGDDNPAIGASGATSAVLIIYALNWPQERWYLFGVVPIPVIWIAVATAAMDVFPMLQQISGRGDGGQIAHSAHVGGMLFGFLYVRFHWQLTGWLNSSQRIRNPFRRRPKLRVLRHSPEDEPEVPDPVPAEIEARLDQLLQKITDEGEASLTAEERRFLAEASRRYRHRH